MEYESYERLRTQHEKIAQRNETFRTVLYTAKNCQLVVMSLKPGEEGAEVHKLDQFFRVEEAKARRCLMESSIASSLGSRSWCRRYTPQHSQRPVRPDELYRFMLRRIIAMA